MAKDHVNDPVPARRLRNEGWTVYTDGYQNAILANKGPFTIWVDPAESQTEAVQFVEMFVDDEFEENTIREIAFKCTLLEPDEIDRLVDRVL